jgi:hypothetical protein
MLPQEAEIKLVITQAHPRKCGDCQLCCKLLPMKADQYSGERRIATVDGIISAGWAKASEFIGMLGEWSKPAGKPCRCQRHGKGCAVYTRRPLFCRLWSCRWLIGDDTADQRRPDHSRVVIDVMPDFITLVDGAKSATVEVVQLWVDARTPDAWREPAMLAYIERRAREGVAALIRLDSKRGFVVFAPPLCADGKWHERHDGPVEPDHTGREIIEGVGAASLHRGRLKIGDRQ